MIVLSTILDTIDEAESSGSFEPEIGASTSLLPERRRMIAESFAPGARVLRGATAPTVRLARRRPAEDAVFGPARGIRFVDVQLLSQFRRGECRVLEASI